MSIRTYHILIARLCHKLQIVTNLILILKVHQVRLMHLHLPIRRVAFALITLYVYSRVASVVAQLYLTCRALLAQTLARICMRRRLPGLRVQRCHTLVHGRYTVYRICILRTTFAALQLLYPILCRVRQIRRALPNLVSNIINIHRLWLLQYALLAKTSLDAVVV